MGVCLPGFRFHCHASPAQFRTPLAEEKRAVASVRHGLSYNSRLDLARLVPVPFLPKATNIRALRPQTRGRANRIVASKAMPRHFCRPGRGAGKRIWESQFHSDRMAPFLSAYAERPLATREREYWEHPGTPLKRAVLSAVPLGGDEVRARSSLPVLHRAHQAMRSRRDPARQYGAGYPGATQQGNMELGTPARPSKAIWSWVPRLCREWSLNA